MRNVARFVPATRMREVASASFRHRSVDVDLGPPTERWTERTGVSDPGKTLLVAASGGEPRGWSPPTDATRAERTSKKMTTHTVHSKKSDSSAASTPDTATALTLLDQVIAALALPAQTLT